MKLRCCIAACLLAAGVHGFTSLNNMPISARGNPRAQRTAALLGMSSEGLRGGAGRSAKKSDGAENHTQEAIAFFGSERLPASLIAGACLSVLFVFQVAAISIPCTCTFLAAATLPLGAHESDMCFARSCQTVKGCQWDSISERISCSSAWHFATSCLPSSPPRWPSRASSRSAMTRWLKTQPR